MVTPHEQYSNLGIDEDLRQAVYKGLFKVHIDAEIIKDIRRSTNGNYALVNNRFKEEISVMLKQRVSPGKAGRPSKEC